MSVCTAMPCRRGVPCFTSLDTANAVADIIAAGYRCDNTELVDLNHMRTERAWLRFAKMEATGDDYIFAENFDGSITCPESLSITLCDRHYGIGAFGLVLLEKKPGCGLPDAGLQPGRKPRTDCRKQPAQRRKNTCMTQAMFRETRSAWRPTAVCAG